MKTNTMNFLVWDSNLFHRTAHFFRVFVPITDPEDVLMCSHEEIGHLDENITIYFVAERYL